MDTTKTITHLGLCAGYGGIELGLHRVIRNLRTVALCEIEAFACANLVSKMEAGLLDAAPIWTNLKSFPWAEFRGRVDILTGGYPCQPFSAAGKRLGTDDPRHLWPFIADGIRILRPKLCFFENVEGHISLGLREVIGELESIGYKTAWGIFSAAEVGAPHQRKRVFILAYDQSQRIQGHWADWLQESRPHAGQGLPLRGGDAGCLANSNHQHGHGEERGWSPEEDRISSEHREEEHSRWELGRADATPAWPSRPGQPQHGWEPPRVVGHATHQRDINETEQDHSEARADTYRASEGAGEDVANSIRSRGEEPEHLNANLPTEPSRGDTEGLGNSSSERPYRGSEDGANQQSEMLGEGHEAVGNAESGWRGESRDEVSARQGHWTARPSRSDEQHSQAQPSMGRDADGPASGLGYAELQVSCDNRTDELRLLGNGVVPATAERAFRFLWHEIIQSVE